MGGQLRIEFAGDGNPRRRAPMAEIYDISLNSSCKRERIK
jgi:hypothetical protein